MMRPKVKKVRKTKHKNAKIFSSMSSSTDSDSDDVQDPGQELFFFANDRVTLMKEVLKILDPRKIKSLAPDSMKNLKIEELNTMLLEELLGISNKRLRNVLNGQNAEDASSSSSEDDEGKEKPIDIISLDDISDDDDFCFIDEEKAPETVAKPKKTHRECKRKRMKKEVKEEDVSSNTEKSRPNILESDSNDKLLSVLELLELQARARAIRSQLVIEAENKKSATKDIEVNHFEDDEDAVVVESPKVNEIVISSSESGNEAEDEDKHETTMENVGEIPLPLNGEDKDTTGSKTADDIINVDIDT